MLTLNISFPSADVRHKTSNLAISRCCFADDGKEMDKNEKCTCRACTTIVFPLNMQICDVLVPVAVVFAKTPYYEAVNRNLHFVNAIHIFCKMQFT